MPFVTPPILDDFNRVENPVSQGGAWSASGIWGQPELLVCDNPELEAGVTSGTRHSYRVAEFGPDVTLSVRNYRNFGTGVFFRLALAFNVDADPVTADAYGVKVDGTSTPGDYTWRLIRIDDGANTQAAGAAEVVLATATVAMDADIGEAFGDDVGFKREGNALSAWLFDREGSEAGTWIEQLSATDSTYAGLTGKIVISIRTTNPGLRNLAGETNLEFIPQIYRRPFG